MWRATGSRTSPSWTPSSTTPRRARCPWRARLRPGPARPGVGAGDVGRAADPGRRQDGRYGLVALMRDFVQAARELARHALSLTLNKCASRALARGSRGRRPAVPAAELASPRGREGKGKERKVRERKGKERLASRRGKEARFTRTCRGAGAPPGRKGLGGAVDAVAAVALPVSLSLSLSLSLSPSPLSESLSLPPSPSLLSLSLSHTQNIIYVDNTRTGGPCGLLAVEAVAAVAPRLPHQDVHGDRQVSRVDGWADGLTDTR